jgi:pimeloyl-ACP methyl ester carboxylesterase
MKMADWSFTELMKKTAAQLEKDEGFLKDAGFSTAAKYFSKRIEFRQDDEVVTFDIRDGKVVGVLEVTHPMGADIVLSAPAREWRRLASGETNLEHATNGTFGEMVVSGDKTATYRYRRAMWLLFRAITVAGGGADRVVDYAADPKPSGREVFGRYVLVNGIRTYFDEAGEGHPCVCIHTASGDSLQWRHVVEGLSDEYHVIAIDLPGHGKSSEPEEGQWYSLSKHIEFLEAFVETLGLKQPVMMGCSMGGNMVIELAARKPRGYAAMISCQGAVYTPTMDRLHTDMLLLDNIQLEHVLSWSLTGSRTPPDRAWEIVRSVSRATAEATQGDLVAYADYDARDRVAGIQTPILLVRGTDDWIVSQEQIESTQSQVPGSRIQLFDGAGHFPMYEQPYEFCETIRAFLKEHGIK